jgi:hypothetical protein
VVAEVNPVKVYEFTTPRVAMATLLRYTRNPVTGVAPAGNDAGVHVMPMVVLVAVVLTTPVGALGTAGGGEGALLGRPGFCHDPDISRQTATIRE